MSNERSRVVSHTALKGGAFDPHVGHIATQIYEFVDKATCMAVAQAKNRADGMIIALAAAQATTHLLAHVSAKDGREPLTPSQVLFAALLAYHSSPYETKFGQAYSEYSPLIVNDALVQFEQITGRQPDDELDEAMCRVCRQFAANPEQVAELNAQRAMSRASEGQTLN